MRKETRTRTKKIGREKNELEQKKLNSFPKELEDG